MGSDYVNSALLEAFTTSQLLLSHKVAEGETLTLFRKAVANCIDFIPKIFMTLNYLYPLHSVPQMCGRKELRSIPEQLEIVISLKEEKGGVHFYSMLMSSYVPVTFEKLKTHFSL